jgi:cell wall-associated NlpC family hydrolase
MGKRSEPSLGKSPKKKAAKKTSKKAAPKKAVKKSPKKVAKKAVAVKPPVKKKVGRKPAVKAAPPDKTPAKKRGRPKGSKSRVRKVPENIIASRDLTKKFKPNERWMILELHDQEADLHVIYDTLECELVRIFGEVTPFFIPAYVERIKDKTVGVDLIGGYVFRAEDGRIRVPPGQNAKSLHQGRDQKPAEVR